MFNSSAARVSTIGVALGVKRFIRLRETITEACEDRNKPVATCTTDHFVGIAEKQKTKTLECLSKQVLWDDYRYIWSGTGRALQFSG